MNQDLTTTEAAEKLQVSKRTVRRMIERGSIHAHKLDPTAKSVYRIPHAEIQRIINERKKGNYLLSNPRTDATRGSFQHPESCCPPKG